MTGTDPPGQSPGPACPGPSRILVVDDERDLADLAEALLCAHGMEVHVAYCADEALLILESDPKVDALFSDVMMPGMTGLQLADTVRQRYPSIRILLTTGFALPKLLVNHGHPHACIAKPYKIDTVLALLRG
jgi:CheY-like chemotaxis protein